MRWWDWTSGVARCSAMWVQPGSTFQCEQDTGHEEPHVYNGWYWTGEFDKRDPWGRGKWRKADAL